MDSRDSLDQTLDSIDLTKSPVKHPYTQRPIEKINEDTSDNDTDKTITFDEEKVKKTYRKDVNAPRKRAKTVKTMKGRTTKMYTINIERKKLLKQRREKEFCNTSDSTIEFQYGHEVAYFDARSKGLVQINNSKHFQIDQYLHDRVTPVTLSPKLIAYDKPIDPAEILRISTCTEMTTKDMNVPTQNEKYPWLDPDDK